MTCKSPRAKVDCGPALRWRQFPGPSESHNPLSVGCAPDCLVRGFLRYATPRTPCRAKGPGLQRSVMKTRQMPDKKIHVRKKVAGGATGAAVGALMGGPVGALVGGVIGAAIGNAAEQGKLQQLSTPSPRRARQLTARARKLTTRVKKETKAAAKKTKTSARRLKRAGRKAARSIKSGRKSR